MPKKYQILTWSNYQPRGSRVLVRDGAETLTDARKQLTQHKRANNSYPVGRFTAEIVRVGSVEWKSTLEQVK